MFLIAVGVNTVPRDLVDFTSSFTLQIFLIGQILRVEEIGSL